MTNKLGRTSDDLTKPKLDLTELVSAADFSMVPTTDDRLASYVHQMLMLGNGPDTMFGAGFEGFGDCEVARVANNRLLLTGEYPATVGSPLVKWIVDLYKTQNPDFELTGPNGPDSDADGGMSSDVLLDYLHKTGLPDGTKVVAYGTIAVSEVQAVERAIAVTGGSVWFDVLVQPGNQNQFAAGQPWTDTGEQPEGGHAILGGGYIPNRRAGTWAAEVSLAESFWENNVERVYIVIWPEHCTETFLASESAATLAAQYEALTGKPLVWPTPPTPVTPPAPPTPVTPPAPVVNPDPADLDLQAAIVKWQQAKGY